jgi:hypothetical protein
VNKYSLSLDRLALLAQRRPHLLAGPLALYKEQEGLDDQQVAALLKCEPEALLRLALCERPRPAPHFREDVERIAAYIHADMMQLARLIRAAEAREALHHRSSAVPPALLAARDQEDAEVVSTEDEDERPDE